MLACGAALFAQGSYCDPQWQTASNPRGVGLTSMIFDGTRFVAMSEAGRILTSTDGESWALESSKIPKGFEFASIQFGNGRYLALPGPEISTDLRHWERLVLQPFYNSMTFAGKFFFAGGIQGQYMYLSKDASHWWGIPYPGFGYLACVTCDPDSGKYVAFMTEGQLGTSSDGMNWVWRQTPWFMVDSIVVGGGRWVAVGRKNDPANNFVAVFLGSADGEMWQELSVPISNGTSMWDGRLAYGGGHFVYLRDWGGDMVSEDGVTWTQIHPFDNDPSAPRASLTFGNGRFVGAGRFGDVWVSQDGANWRQVDLGEFVPGSLTRMAWLGEPPRLYAFGDDGMAVSDDGLSWSMIPGAPRGLGDMAYGGGQYVVVAGEGIIASSSDTVSWEVTRPGGYYVGCVGVSYGSGRFVAVGYHGEVFWSTSGGTWNRSNLPPLGDYEYVTKVTFANGLFVVGTWRGLLFASADGQAWQVVYGGDGSRAEITSIVHGSHGFIAGRYGGYLASPDGLNWEVISPGFYDSREVWLVNGFYITPGDPPLTDHPYGNMRVSADGRNWSWQPLSMPIRPHGLVGDGIRIYGLGASGCMLSFVGEGCKPSVTGLSPTVGPSEGGTEVSITGSDLSAVTSVHFGSKPAASFKIFSDTLITAITPPHDHIAATVTADSPEGTSISNGLSWFTFQSPVLYFEMIAIRWQGSSSKLFINGYGFKEGCSVRIDGRQVPKLKIMRIGGNGSSAVVTGGAALKAMLPKGRNVLITIDNPGEPAMTAMAIFFR